MTCPTRWRAAAWPAGACCGRCGSRDEVWPRTELEPRARPGGSWRFARPYRRDIVVFLVTVVLAAVIGVATPVLAGDVINAISRRRRRAPARAVVRLALLIAGLAVVDALLSLAQRWYSARIGEGIILDLRTRVYDHVQRMPLQFFTRTQTGALVSRLNNDVHGRPAGVHLHAVRRGQQRHPAGAHRRR